jgi:hypothetical protein
LEQDGTNDEHVSLLERQSDDALCINTELQPSPPSPKKWRFVRRDITENSSLPLLHYYTYGCIIARVYR